MADDEVDFDLTDGEGGSPAAAAGGRKMDKAVLEALANKRRELYPKHCDARAWMSSVHLDLFVEQGKVRCNYCKSDVKIGEQTGNFTRHEATDK